MKNSNEIQVDITKNIKLFKERFKSLKEEKGVTYKDIEDATYININTLQTWARKDNASLPQTEYLIRLAHYFGVTTDYLIGKEDYENIEDLETKTASAITGLTPTAVDTLRFCNESMHNGRDVNDLMDSKPNSPYNPNILKLLNELLKVENSYSQKPLVVTDLNTTEKKYTDSKGVKCTEIFHNLEIEYGLELLNKLYDYLFTSNSAFVDKNNKIIETKNIFTSDRLGRANNHLSVEDIDSINMLSLQKFLNTKKREIAKQQKADTDLLNKLLEKLENAKNNNSTKHYNAVATQIRLKFFSDILNYTQIWDSKYNNTVEALRQEFFESVTGSKAPLFPVMI